MVISLFEIQLLIFIQVTTAKGMADIKVIELKGLSADSEGKIQIEDFIAEGNRIELDLPSLSLSTGSFSIKENRFSSLDEVNMEYHTDKGHSKSFDQQDFSGSTN